MYMTIVPRARRLAFLLQQNIKSGRPRTSSPSLAAAAVVGLESLLNGSLQTLGDPSQPHRRASFWSRKPAPDGAMSESEEYKVQKTESEWKAALTAEEYRVLRQKGTERAGTGEYDKFYPEDGYFVCRACQNPLYSSTAKFNSGCGWPAFDKCYEGSVKIEVDNSFGMRRVEIMCAACGGHLGHVFEGERMTATNERHCVNSIRIAADWPQ